MSNAPAAGASDLGFSQLKQNFESMSLEGCSEDQRARIPLLIGMAEELANAARGSDKAMHQRDVELAGSGAVQRFAYLLERFETRRRVMRQDLGRMRSGIGNKSR